MTEARQEQALRTNGRTPQLRPITFETGFTKWAKGNVPSISNP